MSTLKDARETKPKASFDDDLVLKEISRTVRLATQALDGFELSDEELQSFCDAELVHDGPSAKKGAHRSI